MITARQLYQNISNKLLHLDFLEELQIEEGFIRQWMESPKFINQISYIITNGDFSCQAVFNLCGNLLDKIWAEECPSNPLFYIYQFTLSKSFPQSVEINLREEWDRGCLLYLQVLKVVSRLEMEAKGDSILQQKPLRFLSQEEEVVYNVSEEYKKFKIAFQKEYIYEMMKLNQEILHHNTLDHISGVHYLALFIGKQLFKVGIPIDLGRVSGAAAGHDLGKFGCKSWEVHRVAYLHYYYTDQWFKKHDIPYIGHIALNHSVWDLELENLSIESLILIYSDFRVKNALNEETKQSEMTFFSLKDSFQVILYKLDNLDPAKERRYRRVYSKLKDFEDYLLNLNIETNPDSPIIPCCQPKKKYYSLMQGREVTENLKYLAIHHNIHLMHQFRSETSLNEVLEVIRSEEDGKNLRAYLNVFQEYCTYLTQKQKMITLRFLYEKLIHPEEDIRRHSAELMGSLILLFDEDYRKEVPEGIPLPPEPLTSCDLLMEYVELFVTPPHQMIPLHRQWMGYSMKVLISYIFSMSSNKQVHQYKEVVLKYYTLKTFYDTNISIYLLEIIKYIPLEKDSRALEVIYEYLCYSLQSENIDLKVASLDVVNYLIKELNNHRDFIKKIKGLLQKDEDVKFPPVNFLKFKIAQNLALEKDILLHYHKLCEGDINRLSDLFLSNLKTATSWVTKKIQVKILLEYLHESKNIDSLYTAMHFCNLLKVSAVESVRNEAGQALLTLFPKLPPEQRNDVAIELLRSLEIEGYQFTKYIPYYLGRVLLHLQPHELDEIIDDLNEKIRQSNTQTKSLLLKTIGIIVSGYPKYKVYFQEEEELFYKRETKLLGILLNGLVHDDLQIRQIAFSVIGKNLFGSKELLKSDKYWIFKRIGKKLLTLLAEIEENQLLFLSNAAALNYIYRFISDYIFEYGEIPLTIPQKTAFFPGTFDPFTLGHKAISKAIREEGFEVFLAVDEFSWSKQTQPNLIRRNIINQSIADEMNIYLYPEDYPINIANPSDLKRLKETFADREVHIVVGSDVLVNASSYQGIPQPNSIHHFPHIIFERRENGKGQQEESDKLLKASINKILAPTVHLTLPPQYVDISSTQIRKYVDEDRDISKLMDPLAQKYIYKNNFYKKEPQYKSVIQTISINVELIESYQEDLIYMLASSFHQEVQQAADNLKTIFQKPDGGLILIKDINNDNNILAYSVFHWIPSDQIYQEFKDSKITEMIRSNYKGRIISFDGFFIKEHSHLNSLYQIILTETLTHSLKKDFGYGIFKNNIDGETSEELMELIKLHGFLPFSVDHNPNSAPILAVDLTNPCTLNLDLETIIKEPFRSNSSVRRVIGNTRKKLQEALTRLYPGNLVLSFDREIIDETLVRKICEENGVSPIPTKPRKLGELMCVPFGNILYKAIVPNTVTKSLHTEKLFYPHMKDFTIGSYPYYLDLVNQVKMIRSFNRPIILVDDLLNKGYRIKALDPLFKSQKVTIKKTIVGILSGKGKELMEIQNRDVDCAYFIPKLNLWFNENLLYPFIGGDTLWRGVYPEGNLLPSINLILPYTAPYFIREVSNEKIYHLSEVSIKNAIEILQVLEAEYQKINERKLTLALLNEVFLYPRCPDLGKNIYYDLSLSPSHYLKNDLVLLKRLESSIITHI